MRDRKAFSMSRREGRCTTSERGQRAEGPVVKCVRSGRITDARNHPFGTVRGHMVDSDAPSKDPSNERRNVLGSSSPGAPDPGEDREAPKTGGEERGGAGQTVTTGFSPTEQNAISGLKNLTFPMIQRRFAPALPWTSPLRRGIDYQSRPGPIFIFCEECRGIMGAVDDHEKDLGACDLEKVRQIMEN